MAGCSSSRERIFKDVGSIGPTEDNVTKEKYDSLKRSHCFPGDLIFPKVGTIGKVGVLSPCKGHDHYVLSTNTMRLRPNEEIACRDYVYYYFCWSKVVKHIHAINSKSVQPVFNFTDLAFPNTRLRFLHSRNSGPSLTFSALSTTRSNSTGG